MDRIQPGDNAAVPGSALNTQSIEASDSHTKALIAAGSDEGIERMLELGAMQADMMLEGTQDLDNNTKLPVPNDDVYYLAGGSLSVNSRDGDLKLTNNLNSNHPGSLSISKKQSRCVIPEQDVVVGAPKFRSMDGWNTNPLDKIFPSSPFTPMKVWVENLVPNLTSIASAAAVFGVLRLIQKTISDETAYTTRRELKELGTIIIDNADYERRILEGKLPAE